MGILNAPDRWIIEWSGTVASGKLVRLSNPVTGQTAVGHDWADWDRALHRAMGKIAQEGDLVGELEEFLRHH